MSKAFDSFCLNREVRFPFAVRLSVYMAVPSIGLGWPSSSSSVWMGHARWQPRKMLDTSASAADATFLMVVHITWMGALFSIVVAGLLVRMNHPEARDFASG